MNSQPSLLLGAHLSTAGGLENVFREARILGCTALQLFTHSNRQWHINALTADEIQRFRDAQKEAGINHVVVHASYLINLASVKAETRALSVATLIKELERCAQLGIKHLILHPGSHVDTTEEAGIDYLVQGLDQALAATPTTTKILLENMAGQGSSLGRHIEQLALIRTKSAQKERIGFCIDTCHLFSAGYDFSDETKYTELWRQLDATIGIAHIHAIHMNDSKKPCGSRVDRHTHIGEGTLGLEPFRLLMNDPRLVHIPKILETPKDSLEEDKKNLATLRSLVRMDI